MTSQLLNWLVSLFLQRERERKGRKKLPGKHWVVVKTGFYGPGLWSGVEAAHDLLKEGASLKGFMWFLPVSPRRPIICWNCLLICDLS